MSNLNEKGTLSINSENIMPIIKKWLYSDIDIFLRELVSNATDAIQKYKKLGDMGETTVDPDQRFAVTVSIDKDAKTITIADNGIGMTADEIKRYINQIAFSGATDFANKYADNLDGNEIIGHFGLGFYSAFMVADRVQINTKSYQDEPAAIWTSDGTTEYEITPSDKTTRGTEITLFINDDGAPFLMEYRVREVLNKYCSFMPIDIFVETVGKEVKEGEEEKAPVPLNKEPLWTRDPKDCTDDDYKKFYRETFNDFNEPLFWIHLNMDYPFTLKGILYFPKLKHEFEQTEGQVKLFCNQVFVADNVKEVIPEFLLLLKGVLDCPDIPLNVSRSFLQNDGNVAKMSSYVAKKVSDKLGSIYKKDREAYIGYWSDISPFIKYGCIREQSFYDKMSKAIIYKNLAGDYVNLDEYIEANKPADVTVESADGETVTDANEPSTVYYVNNPSQQAQYVQMFLDNNMDALILDTNLDAPFISYLESYQTGVKFARIDSDMSSLSDESADTSQNDSIIDLFKGVLAKELTYKVQALKTDSVPAVMVSSEDSRRMQEMMKMFGGGGPDMPVEHELVLNSNNSLIQKLLASDTDTTSKELIVNHVYDLARIGQKPLDMDEMNQFIARNNQMMELLLG